MTPLYIYNGGLLVRDGALAASQSCCCGIILCVDPWYVGVFMDTSPPFCVMETTEFSTKYCIDCGESISTYPPPTFASSVIYDCQNICQAQPAISYNHWTSFYTRGNTTIDFRGYGELSLFSFSVDIDAALINTDYPAASGWVILYTEDLLLNETYIDTDNCDNQKVCRKWGFALNIYAVKDCLSDNPAEVVDITGDVALSTTTFCQDTSAGGPYAGCPDCPSPPVIAPTAYCIEECPGAGGGTPGDGL